MDLRRLIDRSFATQDALVESYFAKATPPSNVIDMRDATQLRLAAIQLIEMNHEKDERIASLEPKAQALDLLTASAGSMTFRQAAKLLGCKQDDMTRHMHADKWIYRENGSWVAYRTHIINGRLQYKEARYTDEKTGLQCIKPYCHITPKGLASLAQIFNPVKSAA